ncbi:flagellar hook protein FlgE [Fundidesulfovibrio butyratiphilus]
MGLATSMWAGVTGLLAHGEKMGVIGNNLANVNTVGFKSQRMDFEDLMYSSIGTAQGMGQLGMGVRVGALLGDFTQGGFQTSNENTDLAISGDGFFTVKNLSTQENFYTRAGNFRFDKNGYLVDPHGMALQGWQVDQATLRYAKAQGRIINQVPTKGSVTSVQLDSLALGAQATNNLTMVTNLDPREDSRSSDTTDPFFSMFKNYRYDPNHPDNPALAETSFSFQNTITVYDQRGGSHDLTVYYDKVSDVSGKEYWEYMVCCTPEEDGRVFNIGGASKSMSSNAKAGVLMIGSLSFNDAGGMENITSYTLNDLSYSSEVSGLNNWSLAKISSSGYPVFTANFRSVSGASITTASNSTSIALNLGIRSGNTTWNTSATTADMLGLSHLTDPAALQGFNPSTLNVASLSTTNYETSSSLLYQSQDGYPPGTLQSVSVDEDGVLTGRFSNGQVQELYVIALADFASPWGLKRNGGNLFSETRDSGEALIGRAKTGRLGSVSGNSLESSNVDMANEMVEMIQTQRGFQANSKVITTTDTMLSEIIQLKR